MHPCAPGGFLTVTRSPQGDTPWKFARMLRHAAKREAVIWAPKHPGPPGAPLTTGEGRRRSRSWGTRRRASVAAARTSARVPYCRIPDLVSLISHKRSAEADVDERAEDAGACFAGRTLGRRGYGCCSWHAHGRLGQPRPASTREPKTYVIPAAAAPRTNWRKPLYHQERAVTRDTSAPHRNRPAIERASAGQTDVAPSR